MPQLGVAASRPRHPQPRPHPTDRGRQYAPQGANWLDDVGNFFADVGTHIVNDVASFGNALLNHPDQVAQALRGIGLTVISSAGEGLGTVLDARPANREIVKRGQVVWGLL